MLKGLYNLFHIPYYNVTIVKNGEKVGSAVVKVSNSRAKYFRLKKYKAVFLLPDFRQKDRDDSQKRVRIEPIRVKSGLLLFYDVKDVFPMQLARNDSIIEELDGESSTREAVVYPSGFIPAPLDIEELHEFLEAKVTEDILSGNEKEIPMWLIYLISVTVMAVVIIGGLYLVTKGNASAPVIAPIVTPTPTPGYVVVP